jgi:pyrrolidone-carboxylate peptidase
LEDAGFEDFNQQEKEPTMSVEKHLNNSAIILNP